MNPRELFRHMSWADAGVWQAALSCDEARRDGELKERLHHIHVVQWVVLQIWRQEEMKVRELSEFETLDDLLAWARSYVQELSAFLEAVEQAELEEEVRLPWRASLEERFGEIRPTNLGETLTQVILHTMHHRGQVATRLRALGAEPPLIDYIAWIWQGRPEADWPSEG